MLVTYTFEADAMSFEIEDSDELPVMFTEATRELVSRHPELAREAGLAATVADRLLNCLCDNAECIDLGELP